MLVTIYGDVLFIKQFLEIIIINHTLQIRNSKLKKKQNLCL